MSIESARAVISDARKNNWSRLYLWSQDLTNEELLELIPEIQDINNLTHLFLNYNKLTNVDCLNQLTKLVSLDLSRNNLTNVDCLNKSNNLGVLNLNHNKIKKINSFSKLTKLITLSISNNSLTSIDFLKNLRILNSLDLSSNNLTNINVLKDLERLTSLCLSGNSNLELPLNLNKMVVENYLLNKNEIERIRSYYRQFEKGKDYVYETRVLVVGEPKAGKTTLTQKVKDNVNWVNNYKEKISEQTIGIEIDKLNFTYKKDKSKNITAHFWDFGGQSIQYVLHQYFFTQRSLYLLLADGRKELPNFNYWFEIIATLGRNCPVLVVLNENGGKPIKTFNINAFRNQFGEHLESIEEESVNFYNDSDGRFETLKNKIENKISNLKHIGMFLPKTWVDVRKELEKLKDENPYIGKDRFLQICEKCNLNNNDYIDQVIDYLHDLGIALNYKNDTNLRSKFILQPNWVIDSLYVVLQDNKIEKECGMFEVEYVESLWKKQGYSFNDCEILLGLMQKGKFEIAYKLKENKFIVPILLPYKPNKNYNLEDVNPIQTHIKYEFMPKGIVPRLIVRLNKNILSINNEQIVWNRGVLLSHHNSIAEVIESEQSKQITIKVIGENKIYNRQLLTIIRNEIVGIHRDWFDNRLIFDELVPCICDVCKEINDKTFYKLKKLEERLRNNKKSIECENDPYHYVNVFDLLSATYIVDKKTTKNWEFSGVVNSTISINVIEDIKDSTINMLVKQSNQNESINQKLDEMFAKLSEKQTNKLQILVNELVAFVDKKIAESGIIDEKVKEYQDIKVSSEWKAKLKASIPIIPKFVSIDFEKEWKLSEDIKPETFIERVRSFLHLQKVKDKPLEIE